MTRAFVFGTWYPIAEAPKVKLPDWIIVTDGKHVVPAFWVERAVSQWYPEGGWWEKMFEIDNEDAMGDLTKFMISPKLAAR